MKKGRSIANSARLLRRLVIFLVIVAVLLHAAAFLPLGPHLQLRFALRYPATGLGTQLASLTVAALFMIALLQLAALLKRIEAGELFTTGVTGALRRFAGFLLIALVAGTLLPLALAAFAPCAPDAGPCLRYIPVDFRAIWMLVIGAALFLVARLLDEARIVEEDNRSIV